MNIKEMRKALAKITPVLLFTDNLSLYANTECTQYSVQKRRTNDYPVHIADIGDMIVDIIADEIEAFELQSAEVEAADKKRSK